MSGRQHPSYFGGAVPAPHCVHAGVPRAGGGLWRLAALALASGVLAGCAATDGTSAGPDAPVHAGPNGPRLDGVTTAVNRAFGEFDAVVADVNRSINRGLNDTRKGPDR